MSLWIDFVEVPSYVDYNGTPRHDVYIKYKDGSEKGVKVHDFATHTQTKIGWENAEQFVNRSDSRGGSTLGSIASALVPLRTMDVGVPILSMHSAREAMAGSDQQALVRLLQRFYQE